MSQISPGHASGRAFGRVTGGRASRFLMWRNCAGRSIVWEKDSSLPFQGCSGLPRPVPHLQEGSGHLGAADIHPADSPQCLKYLLMPDPLWTS